jgi:hypothetical protein
MVSLIESSNISRLLLSFLLGSFGFSRSNS